MVGRCCGTADGRAAARPYRVRSRGRAVLPRRRRWTRSSASLPSSVSGVRRRCRAADGHAAACPTNDLPMNLMHAALIGPILRFERQAGANWILPHVKPFLMVILLVPQTMMEPAALEFTDGILRLGVGRRCCAADGRAAARPYRFPHTRERVPAFPVFCKTILPKSDPAFDGELKIIRRTEQMQMIGHQQIIAHQPGRSPVLPNVVKRALNRGLGQPAFALFRANGQKNPIRSAQGKVNASGRRAALQKNAVHIQRMASRQIQGNSAIKAEAKAGRRCRAADGRAAARPCQKQKPRSCAQERGDEN